LASILIVDDEEMDRLFNASILEEAGHKLSFANHGQAALKVWDENFIDLVITDLAMPELNGLRLIQALRQRDPSVKIIAVSGVASDQLDLAENYGAKQTLFKPISREALLTAVKEVLDLSNPEPLDPWKLAR